jgi:endonuclease III related protein
VSGNTTFQEIYNLLLECFGPQSWWPGDSAIEMIVGAVLTQNTNWGNVTKAIANLRDREVLNFTGLESLSTGELADYIRPSGYYNIKARRLQNLLTMIRETYAGDLDALLTDETASARRNLLSVQGIGPETADSILLYAGNHPIFVVDAYTHRVFSRHYLIAEECDYHELQDEFMSRLPQDPQLFNEYHALIVMVGKHFCKKTNPLCESCPLGGVNHIGKV